MSHPKRFDDADPVLAKVREICLALPGADVKVSHGRPAFFTKKIFAGYGAVLKGDHDSDRYDQSVVIMADADEAEALAQDDRFFTPAYWGPYGWIGMDLRGSQRWSKGKWTEVAELVEESYRLTAPKTLIKELDER